MSKKGGQHERKGRFITTRLEAWALPRLARRLPASVLPDHLTVVGLVAATGVGAAYMLSEQSPLWMWVASLGLIIHWFADSLDGTLARVRRIERPRYGFYLDHLSDAFSTFVIGLGLGLSPYMLLAVSLAIVVAYLVLSINVYLETHIFGEFRYGYGVIGPTEARFLLIVLNITAATAAGLPFNLFGVGMTIFDLIGIGAAVGMIGLLIHRVARNLRTLARLEPANRVREKRETNRVSPSAAVSFGSVGERE